MQPDHRFWFVMFHGGTLLCGNFLIFRRTQNCEFADRSRAVSVASPAVANRQRGVAEDRNWASMEAILWPAGNEALHSTREIRRRSFAR